MTIHPVIALVQARMGSTRLPGKMMMDLSGRPVLAWVLERTGRASTLDRVVLCTTDDARDSPLAELAEEMGVDVFRGAENDVLGRFAAAASDFGAKTVVRICADNPLIAPEAIDIAVNAFAEMAADYVFNHVPGQGSDWPDGFGAEVLSAKALIALAEETTDPQYREHVTLALRQNPDRYRIASPSCPENWQVHEGNMRLDIDTIDDMKIMHALCHSLDLAAGPAEILARWQDLHKLSLLGKKAAIV